MAKRGQNEGSITKRKDGRWVARLTIGYEGGKQKRKCIYGRTREEVAGKLAEALKAKRDGLPVTNDRITFGQFLDKWLEDSVRPSVRATTYYRYTREVRLHIEPTLGKVKLAKLCPGDIQALLNTKLKDGLSPASVRHMHAVIRRSLEQAYQWQLVPRNVAKLVRAPRVQRYEAKTLSPEEAAAFLEAVKGDRLAALYTVAMALGLRRGEALALKWEDIDMESGTLRVRHTLKNLPGGGWSLTEPKSRQSRRTLGLPQFAIQSLREHRRRQLEEKMLAGSHWQDHGHGFVFTSIIGTPLDGDNVYKLFRRLLKENELPDIRFHDLRHSCASLLLAKGISPRVIMETLGHSQISLTMDTYSHVMPVLMKEAADAMDAILSGGN